MPPSIVAKLTAPLVTLNATELKDAIPLFVEVASSADNVIEFPASLYTMFIPSALSSNAKTRSSTLSSVKYKFVPSATSVVVFAPRSESNRVVV